MSDLLELAERCEAATDGCRFLDASIFAKHDYGAYRRGDTAPAYTNSLDAAMSLSPDERYGRSLRMETKVEQESGPDLCVAIFTLEGSKRWEDERTGAKAITLPLAVCAASLRALAQAKEPH